jgi:hypothetical protein
MTEIRLFDLTLTDISSKRKTQVSGFRNLDAIDDSPFRIDAGRFVRWALSLDDARWLAIEARLIMTAQTESARNKTRVGFVRPYKRQVGASEGDNLSIELGIVSIGERDSVVFVIKDRIELDDEQGHALLCAFGKFGNEVNEMGKARRKQQTPPIPQWDR